MVFEKIFCGTNGQGKSSDFKEKSGKNQGKVQGIGRILYEPWFSCTFLMWILSVTSAKLGILRACIVLSNFNLT